MFGRPRNEIELLRASLGGNTQAFGVLVGRYQSLVCAITYSATGSVERSEELAQEAFLKAWKSLTQLEDLSKFRAWLSSITRNTVQNWHRSQQRDVVGTAAPLERAAQEASEESGPVEAAMIQEQQTVVSHALAQIPESLREPLVLFYREQKSVREVARQLGLSENAARQRISRGRGMLREQVADMVETTIARTRPGKAFTNAVIAAVAGAALKTSASGAAAGTGQVATAAGGTLGVASLMSGLTAKLTAVAAGAVLIAGSIITYRQFTKPTDQPADGPPVRQASVVQDEPTIPISQARSATNAMTEPAAHSDSHETTGAPDAPTTEPLPVAERARQDSDPKPFEFKPKGVLSGLITDIETGEPVRDAIVRIAMQRIFETHTDANGFYCFEEIHKPGNFDIAIDSKEYIGIPVSQENPIMLLSMDRQAVRHFQLSRACMVDLWVVDANGVGIKDAEVVPTFLADSENRVVSYFGSTRKTDPNGYLLLGGFPPAETDYLITAWHNTMRVEEVGGRRMHYGELDYALAKVLVRLTDPNVVRQVRLVLAPGEDVHGYIEYADGMPATDVEVVARPAWWHCNYGLNGWKVKSDGTFTLKHITPGVYDICYKIRWPDSIGGPTRTAIQARLPAGDGEPLIVRIPEKSPQSLVSISGRFIFVGEKKPRYIDIDASSPSSGYFRRVSVGYGPDGQVKDTFVLDRLEPATYRLRFSGDGLEEKVLENAVAPSANLEVELICLRKPKIAGTVVEARGGEPVTNFRVRLRKLATLRGPHYVQDGAWAHFEGSRGNFQVETVGPGVYQVQVVAAGYAPKWSAEINTDEAKPALVMLSTGGSMSGRVVDEKGEPVSGAKVVPLSLAGGTMPRTGDLFVSEDGAVETAGGTFTLQNLPAGIETLKVTHPDYAFRIVEDIRVDEGGKVEGIEVVLTEGGTVEGYVYDDQGVPQAGEVIYFQDQSGYGGSGDEEAGRLATAVTDANGFYRVAHLPPQLYYAKRANEWRSLGVVRRTVVPRNGKVTRLDFGGTPLVSGALFIDGAPGAGRRLLLSSPKSSYSRMFQCYTKTDEQGAFVFQGVVPGRHAIYYEHPEKRNEWFKTRTIVVASADLDLGIVDDSVPRLLVTLKHAAAGPDGKISRMFLSENGKMFAPLAQAETPSHEGKPWIIHNAEPGKYMLVVVREDQVHWGKQIELAPGRSEWQVSLDIPNMASRLSGRVIGAASPGVMLWREPKDILASVVAVSPDGTYEVKNLPAGRYFLGDFSSLLYHLPATAEFYLQEGENKIVDLDLSRHPKPPTAMLAVCVVDAEGTVRDDARLLLQGPLGAVEPVASTEIGSSFVSLPGEHILQVAAPGCTGVEKKILLKPCDLRVGKPQTVIVYLDRE